jgi:hypothetical protein
LKVRQIDREDAVALPGWSKTVRAEPSGRIDLTSSETGMTFLRGSAEMLAEMGRQNIPMGSGFLFRPLDKSRKGLRDEPLKFSALRQRVETSP